MVEEGDRYEYRAIVERPASILDSDSDREAGHVVFATEFLPKPDRNLVYTLLRSAESHATLVRWERRWVTVGEWEPND